MDLQLAEHVEVMWTYTKELLNSVFFTAIAGSLAGAFAGAYGAQRIAEKAKYREQLINEIRGTNTATMLAFGICNSLLSVKRQHVKPLKEIFETQKAALLDHKQKRDSGQISKDSEFYFTADMQTLSLPPLPVEILQAQVLEKMSIEGRPISLATTLGQTIHSLRSSLELRNQLIESYRAKEGVSPAEYFGLPLTGQINEMYPASIRAIYTQTDDGIFFSHLLCHDMIDHGNRIVELFKKNFKKGAPTISKLDFSKAEQLGLMPNAEDYADWSAAFLKRTDVMVK